MQWTHTSMNIMNNNNIDNHLVTQSSSIQLHQNTPASATQWNIFGLRHRLAELQLIVREKLPTAILLQETLLPDKSLPENFLNKYTWYTKQGPHASNRNGVAIAIAKNSPHNMIPVRTDLQAIAIQIQTDIRCTLVSIYIPPRGIGSKALECQLMELVGDFNAASQLWGSNTTNDRGRAILRFAEECQLVPMNDGSMTRLDPATGKMTAIDSSFVSLEIAHKFKWSVDEDNRGSDHFPTHLSLHSTVSTKGASRRPRWIYDQANWGLFQTLIDNKLNEADSVNLNTFTAMVTDAASLSIPRTSGQPGRRCVPWWGASVKKAIKNRRKALRKLRSMSIDNPDRPTALKNFQVARGYARKAITQAKKESWDKFLSSFNPETESKSIWNKVHILCGVRKDRKIKLSFDDEIITDETKLADIFSKQFENTSATANYSSYFQDVKNVSERHQLNFNTDEQLPFNTNFSLQELEWALNKA